MKKNKATTEAIEIAAGNELWLGRCYRLGIWLLSVCNCFNFGIVFILVLFLAFFFVHFLFLILIDRFRRKVFRLDFGTATITIVVKLSVFGLQPID
ncbi:hypothetical protein CGZ80_24465 [Rhodopirellula sp. MGV]|nr:hypothetical protein CGZ80_24465 [Rhodopirellula sp. MGV]